MTAAMANIIMGSGLSGSRGGHKLKVESINYFIHYPSREYRDCCLTLLWHPQPKLINKCERESNPDIMKDGQILLFFAQSVTSWPSWHPGTAWGLWLWIFNGSQDKRFSDMTSCQILARSSSWDFGREDFGVFFLFLSASYLGIFFRLLFFPLLLRFIVGEMQPSERFTVCERL